MAGWKEIPADTTIGRIMKMVTQGDIVERRYCIVGFVVEAHTQVMES